MNSLSKKKDNIFSCSLKEATKSDLLFKHGCVATYGGKIIARGYNTYKCYSSNDSFSKDQCSCHAEIIVIRKVIFNNRNNKRKLNRVMKKMKLYISRYSENNNYNNSAPCVNCLEVIKQHNIRKIIFNLNNEFFEYNSKDYHTNHRTFGDITRKIKL
jgi:tRNA(Arg) A34 adenosine deaminase TadA